MFVLSQRSRNVLATVKPELRKVVERAIQITPVDFAVVQGGRTLDEQYKLYGKGRTTQQMKAVGGPIVYALPGEAKVTWIDPRKGNHVVDKVDGLGRAVDLVPFHKGAINWDNNGKLGLWVPIARAMKQAAMELGVSIEWGGDWTTTKDRPHFELVR